MADMQLIVAPLGGNGDQGGKSEDATGRPGSSKAGNSDVLSAELRDNFEAMKSVWRQARRADTDETEDLRRKEREIAVETALALDAEISRWQTGIAELEALLATEESAGEDDTESDQQPPRERPRNVIQFPSLLPVIAPEDDDITEGSLDSSEHCDAIAVPSTGS